MDRKEETLDQLAERAYAGMEEFLDVNPEELEERLLGSSQRSMKRVVNE